MAFARSGSGNLSKDRIEPISRFVLHPMTGPGDHFEAGAGLNVAQRAGAVVEMGIGGGVTLSPDPVEARLDQRKGSGERVGP